MKYRLDQLVDMSKIEDLLEAFSSTIDIPSAIIDLEGNILAAAGWNRICTDFHRVNEESCKLCLESDTQIANMIEEGNKVNVYKCKLGLTDAASPIIIEGEHIANAFVGQFLLDEPDLDGFRQQASKYGFDMEDYMEALKAVPIVDQGRLPGILKFLTTFSEIAAQMGLDRLRQIKTSNRVEAQAREIIDISTPVLKVWDGVLVSPLIGSLDSRRAEKFTEVLLNGVAKNQAQVVLIDITGVAAIDTQIARHLLEASSAVQLLGAKVILTGVRPAIAQTFVHLGVDLEKIISRSSLASGLEYAIESMKPMV